MNETTMQSKLSASAGAPPVGVFQGYDSVTGAGRSTAVSGETQTVGGSSGVAYRVCMDVSTLAQTLNISQSLSVSYGPIGSVDEKMDFMRKLNVTTNSISIVVYARHVLGTDVVTNAALNQGIAAPVSNSDIRKFFSSYGDSYVSSRTRGGEYYAVYTFYSETREEQQSLAIDLKAHGLYDGVTVDASLQTKLSTFTSTTKTRVSLNQNISGIQNPSLPDGNGIIAFALGFPSQVLTAPAIIAFLADGYEHVPNFGAFGTVPANRNYFGGTGIVDGLTATLVQVQQLKNQIGWLQSIYNFYGYSGDSKLSDSAGKAQHDLAAINTQIQAWVSDPTQSFTAPSFQSTSLGTPSLNYSIAYSPAHGGGGGGPFFDINPTTYIQQQSSIANVQLRSGGYVDALIVTYQTNKGSQQFKHGGDGGNLSALLTLLPGQFVTRIFGRSGEYVDNLTVQLSDGRTVGGGGGGGGPYDWSVPSGSFVLGFSGRSGGYLDQIQVIYATLAPAKWQ
jgi:hypothetical protein